MLQMMSTKGGPQVHGSSESDNAQFELMLTRTLFTAAFSLASLEIR